MARPCSICNHSERLEIDRLLLSGEPYRNIAERFKLSIGSISRHREAHIGTDLKDVREAMEQAREEALAQIKSDELEAIKEEISTEAAESMAARLGTCASFLDQLKVVRDRAANLLDRAESSQDMKSAGNFLRELREQIRLMAELEGKISQQPQVTIINNPEWIELRTVIIQALDPYPEAKEALVNAIRGR
jgi:SpoVK/Ycf46/Vps4 family AAA+-type ATPase